jgi:hypothetical protein
VSAPAARREELIMEYRVDDILNGWFGEPPEHSDQEQQLLRHLYAPLRKLEDELRAAQAQLRDQSWQLNPDRSGGQFPQEELDNSNTWR